MNTQEAIQNLRPLGNWTKSVVHLQEILELVLAKESTLEQMELRLSVLTAKIDDADKKYSAMLTEHKEVSRKMEEENAEEFVKLNKSLEAEKGKIEQVIKDENAHLKSIREEHKKVMNRLKDEEAVLVNAIRDKEAVLTGLAENLKLAMQNTNQFISQMQKEGQV